CDTDRSAEEEVSDSAGAASITDGGHDIRPCAPLGPLKPAMPREPNEWHAVGANHRGGIEDLGEISVRRRLDEAVYRAEVSPEWLGAGARGENSVGCHLEGLWRHPDPEDPQLAHRAAFGSAGSVGGAS